MGLDKILEQLDNEAFLNSLGIQANRRGKWLVDCPFCGGKEKLSIDIQKGVWKCYRDSCGEKGNMISLYSKLHTCSNGEAVKAIKEFIGIKDDDSKPSSSKPKQNKKSNIVPLKPKLNDSSDIFNELTTVDTKPTDQAPMASLTDIYNEFIKLATLTEAHRAELKNKRGFSDKTIEELSFRSGGEYLKNVINLLREKFSDDDLRESGILFEVNGNLSYNEQLLDDRIIIPYLNAQNEVYHIRPHKLGFQGFPPELYCEKFLAEVSGEAKEVILTEGEFKAAAIRQLGLIGVAVPGISSFGAKWLQRLVDVLKLHSVKKIHIIYDNEIKDDPAFPNFKEQPEKRWDADYWTYMMAYLLGKEGFIVRCGKLPDEWMVQGKIDFDGALAAGKTRNDIQKVISKSVPYKEYLATLPDEAQRILKRKIANHFATLPVKRDFNRYVATRVRGTEAYEEVISNFIINIKSSCFTSDGVIRNVQFVNEFGEKSAVFSLNPGEMAGLTEIKKFCFSKGNYIFEGTGTDLINVWKLEFSRDMGDLIYMPDRIGYIEEEDLWLFGNLAIHKGIIYRPDSDGIMWVKGKGFKPLSIRQNSQGEASEEAIPTISEKSVDLIDIAEKLKHSVGGYEAYMGIGWVIATIFSKDIFNQYKCIPILFPHGKRESGKSTFMRWIMSFFGVDIDGVGIAETTQNFIARALSYYSSIGCWFDEYRNEPRVVQKDGFFRSAYNRQLSGKGTATAFQTKGFSVHSTIAISGEEMPKDNGLFTRLVPLQFSSYKRDREYYAWINRHCDDFSYLTYYLIINYQALLPKVMQAIADLKEALLKRDISDRTSENWAICAGAFHAVLIQDPEFIRWVEKSCQEVKMSGEKEHMLNQFLTDVEILFNEHEITTNSHVFIDKDKLNIWLTGVYGIWSKFYRAKTGREPFDEQSIRKYLMDEPYFITSERVYFGDGRKRAMILNIEKAPDPIQELADIIRTRAQKQAC